MNSILIKAVIVVTFALIFYSIAVVTEQRKGIISRQVRIFITVGVISDISSTILMIVGSRKIPITIHGFLGYTALIAMLIDTIWIWRFWSRRGSSQVTKALNIYTRIAYSWWVIAYLAGATIAMMLKS